MNGDNQQERLIDLGWIIGFVDGEGCFSLGLVRQPSLACRKGYKAGYQMFHEFAVHKVLKALRAYKDCVNFSE